MISLLFVLIGAALGYWRPGALKRLERHQSRALDVLLLGLLFFTSVTFGLDRTLRGSLVTLGLSSLATGALTVAASAVAGWLWGRRMDTLRSAGTAGAAPASEGSSSPASHGRAISALAGLSVVTGWALGSVLTLADAAALTQRISTFSLDALLLVIGYDLGKERIWRKMREYGLGSLTLPLVVGLATLASASLAGLLTRIPVGQAICAGSGFGWYSMAGPMALEQAGTEVGAYVFLSNMFRETITIIALPYLAGRIPPAAGAAMGGATSMDSALTVIRQSWGPVGAMWGLVVGTTLSLAGPFLLNLFLKLLL